MTHYEVDFLNWYNGLPLVNTYSSLPKTPQRVKNPKVFPPIKVSTDVQDFQPASRSESLRVISISDDVSLRAPSLSSCERCSHWSWSEFWRPCDMHTRCILRYKSTRADRRKQMACRRLLLLQSSHVKASGRQGHSTRLDLQLSSSLYLSFMTFGCVCVCGRGLCVCVCVFTDVTASRGTDHLALDWHVCRTAGRVGPSPEASLHNLVPFSYFFLVALFVWRLRISACLAIKKPSAASVPCIDRRRRIHNYTLNVTVCVHSDGICGHAHHLHWSVSPFIGP